MSDALIHALVIHNKEAPRALDLAALKSWTPDQGLLWVHLDANHADTSAWLRGDAHLPHLMPEALTVTETRPRVSVTGDGVLVVLRGVNLNPGADPEDMVSIRLWVDEHRIISTRRRRLLSVPDAVNSLKERAPTGSADILLRVIDRLHVRIGDAINDMEERIADLEDDVLVEPTQVMRSRLSELRREAISLRRYLAPQREALGRLLSDVPDWFRELDRMRVREEYDRLVRLVEDLDAVRERATVVHEELVSQLSDELNKRMYVLSIVAALFLPLGFLTGLLGINVGGIPGADNQYAFWIFVSMLVGLVAAQAWFFIRKKWF